MARMSFFERWLVNSPFRAWLQRREVDAFRAMDRSRPRRRRSRHGLWARRRQRASSGSDCSRASSPPSTSTRRWSSLPAVDCSVEASTQTSDCWSPTQLTCPFPTPPSTLCLSRASCIISRIGRLPCERSRACSGTAGGSGSLSRRRGRLTRGLYRMLPHAVESMFDADEWRTTLADAGLRIGGATTLPLWDICGVAMKPS